MTSGPRAAYRDAPADLAPTAADVAAARAALAEVRADCGGGPYPYAVGMMGTHLERVLAELAAGDLDRAAAAARRGLAVREATRGAVPA